MTRTITGGVHDLGNDPAGRDLEGVVAVRAGNVDVVRAIDPDTGGARERTAGAIAGGVDDLRGHVARRDAKHVLAEQANDVDLPAGTDGEVDRAREAMRPVAGRVDDLDDCAGGSERTQKQNSDHQGQDGARRHGRESSYRQVADGDRSFGDRRV